MPRVLVRHRLLSPDYPVGGGQGQQASAGQLAALDPPTGTVAFVRQGAGWTSSSGGGYGREVGGRSGVWRDGGGRDGGCG